MKQALLKVKRQLPGAIAISYFFNARGEDPLEKTTLGMYRSLLHQLLKALPHLELYFLSTFQAKGNHGEVDDWTIEELQSFLLQAVELLKENHIIIFIDALDECKEDDVRDMVGFLEDLGQEAITREISLNVCLSSRHYPYISIRRGISLTVEDKLGHDEDIIAYVDDKLSSENGSPQMEELKSDICEKSSGVFLWVVLVVQILRKTFDHGQVHAMRKRLGEIPPELGGLFADILTRDVEDKDRSILILQWMLFAKRSLTPIELYFGVISGTVPVQLRELMMGQTSSQIVERYILSCSKGLVEVSKSKDHTVQFIHETVRDFLLQENGLAKLEPDLAVAMVGSSQDRLRECCFQYFVMNEIPHPGDESKVDTATNVSTKFPFLEYATMHMFSHAESAESGGVSQKKVLKAFYKGNGRKLEKWIYLYNLFQPFKVRRYTPTANLLYISADQNLPSIARILVDEKIGHRAEGERFGNALQAACAKGHIEIAQILIDDEADVNARGGEHYCALCAAILTKNEAIVQLLLKTNINLKSTGKSGQTALSLAAEKGNLGILKLLLVAEGVGLDSKDRYSQTPLLWAARNGHLEVVKLLLATKGVKPDSKDKDSHTPLSWAARNGHLEVVQLLLATKGVEPDSKNEYGWTPLMRAAGDGHLEIVKLLLATEGVEPDGKDKNSETPLSWAARNGHLKTVKLLLATKGVELNSKDKDGWTPLAWATKLGNLEVVKLLLATKGVEPDSKDNRDQTPLLFAARNGNLEVVKLLLATKGVEPNSKDKDGWTPLAWADHYGRPEVVRLLKVYLTTS
jgi:ankyrin repeat protein